MMRAMVQCMTPIDENAMTYAQMMTLARQRGGEAVKPAPSERAIIFEEEGVVWCPVPAMCRIPRLLGGDQSSSSTPSSTAQKAN
mmetsp:Transcript_19699/g.63324  ORF Transcript_19699/g.63324 Transcript_19699/m.63324 type:complete len:84 (+) Transcript_19699:252-503(+)